MLSVQIDEARSFLSCCRRTGRSQIYFGVVGPAKDRTLAVFLAGVSRSYFGYDSQAGRALVRSFKSVMHDPDFLRLLMFGFVIDQARSFFIRHFRLCEGQDASVLMLADLSSSFSRLLKDRMPAQVFRRFRFCEGQGARGRFVVLF